MKGVSVVEHSLHIEFDNSFAREMDGFYAEIEAERAPAPTLVKFNTSLANELGLDSEQLSSGDGLEMLAGNLVPDTAHPLAQAYAGHQFGGFSPSLGDGRALLLGEILDPAGNRYDMQLKGSGRTPFSRNGDGKAALGPVLREYIFSESMHALGIPTTRSLAAVKTGSDVIREKRLPGAVLTRIASSHLRVGTFQFFAARGQSDKVKRLADYAIDRHDPDISGQDDQYEIFLDRVIKRQTKLVAMWMSVGFIHGVMNTDNMTISGETIDYGPCAFLDAYHPDTVFSSIDDHGRYAYKMQPLMAQWNLARFAESLLGILVPDNRDEAVEIATRKIEEVPRRYERYWLAAMRKKIGLESEQDKDEELITSLLSIMAKGKADFTLTFRHLALAVDGNNEAIVRLFSEPSEITNWLTDWRKRLAAEKTSDHATRMNMINPSYIPRNHIVEDVLRKASDDNDFSSFELFSDVLQRPYEQQNDFENFESGAPDSFGPHITYCGT